MSSSKAKQAVKEIVGRLTKTEVLGCLPIGWVRWKDGRTWSALKDVLPGLSKDMKARIYEAACTKDRLLKEKLIAGRKRKRSEYEWSRRMRRRINDGDSDGM
jgi:hypothetical protein